MSRIIEARIWFVIDEDNLYGRTDEHLIQEFKEQLADVVEMFDMSQEPVYTNGLFEEIGKPGEWIKEDEEDGYEHA